MADAACPTWPRGDPAAPPASHTRRRPALQRPRPSPPRRLCLVRGLTVAGPPPVVPAHAAERCCAATPASCAPRRVSRCCPWATRCGGAPGGTPPGGPPRLWLRARRPRGGPFAPPRPACARAWPNNRPTAWASVPPNHLCSSLFTRLPQSSRAPSLARLPPSALRRWRIGNSNGLCAPSRRPRPPVRPAARRHAGAHGLDRPRCCWGGLCRQNPPIRK